MIYNRLGDAAFILAICMLWRQFGTLDFGLISILAPITVEMQWNDSTLDIISLLLLLGATGKSAQLGLHAWLSDAMEGPTPVSALIHAATMVTAGVFLLFRCQSIISNSLYAGSIIALLGSFTAFVAAGSALAQSDIKKIIALSTCSQLGYMVAGIGLCLGSAVNSAPHLVNHACFKALLFLSAGTMITVSRNDQDLRKISGNISWLRFTGICLSIASLSLSGMPFLSGSFSKDWLINSAVHSWQLDPLDHVWSIGKGILSSFPDPRVGLYSKQAKEMNLENERTAVLKLSLLTISRT